MFEDDVTVPAGWYPDPMGMPQLRWWNNQAWTELTTEARPPLVMQTPTRLAYADDDLPTRREQREQRERDEEYAHLATDEGDARDTAAAQALLAVTLKEIDPPPSITIETPEPVSASTTPSASPAGDVVAAAPDPDLDMDLDLDLDNADTFDNIFRPRSATTAVSAPIAQSERARTADSYIAPTLLHTSTVSRLPIYTAPAWTIALIPLLLLVLSLLLLLGFGSTLSGEVTAGFWAGSYVLVVVLAIADRAKLKRAGYEHSASWAWALLSAPVYLIARSMSLSRVGPLGFAPVLVWAALGLLQVASVLVVPGLLISAIPAAFSTEAQVSVASEASIIGAKLDVRCPSTPPVIIGQQFTCTAKRASGDTYDVTVSLQRVNGWINWRVDDWGIYSLSR